MLANQTYFFLLCFVHSQVHKTMVGNGLLPRMHVSDAESN